MVLEPKVSIIIPTYNCSAYLSQAIASVRAQTYTNVEIIVVDDGSTDNTSDLLAEYRGVISALHQTNRGPGAARNVGIHASSGEYLVFLDADDLILPEMLETLVNYLNQHLEVDIAYCDGYLIVTDGKENVIAGKFSETGFLDRTLGTPEVSLPVLVGHNAFPIHAAMVRKQRVLDLGGFDEDRKLMVFADWEFWYRLAHQTRFAFIDRELVVYRMIASGISSNPYKLQAACEAIENKIIHRAGYASAAPRYQARLYFELGVILLRSGNRTGALHAFRKAIRIHPYGARNWIAYTTSVLIGRDALVLSGFFRSIFKRIRNIFGNKPTRGRELAAALPTNINIL